MLCIQQRKMWKSLVCLLTVIITDVVVCKPDYHFNQEVNGWLKLHPVPSTWQQAFANCHYEGAVLASPINPKLATALDNIMGQSELDSPIFLGVNAVSQGDFSSLEGVPLSDLSITWGTYVGGKKSENCLSLSTDGKTYISSCSELLPYICFKKNDNSTILNDCGTFDDDYILYPVTGNCYKYHKKTTSWTTAHKICAAEGGHLLIINDEKEAGIITVFMDKPLALQSWANAVYVGILDRNKDHTFLTLHGEKVENVYNRWTKGQPDNKGVNLCGLVYPEGTLDDVHCDNQGMRFICEKSPKNVQFENISDEDFFLDEN